MIDDTNKEEAAVEETVEAQAAPQAPVALNIQDLANIIKINSTHI